MLKLIFAFLVQAKEPRYGINEYHDYLDHQIFLHPPSFECMPPHLHTLHLTLFTLHSKLP